VLALTGWRAAEVGWDGALEAAQAHNVALRLMSESVAHAPRQLGCLHGVEN
jgi:hypothetical protein